MADGAIFYRGPSMIDGSPIVGVVTGLHRRSANAKTGPMIQTYIIRSDVPPTEASKNGQDRAICGDCPLRFDPQTGKRVCYVVTVHGPRSVYTALDTYPDFDPAMVTGRSIRLGTYGDPAAIPVWVWFHLTQYARHWTGYTHQWRHQQYRRLQAFCMASCETPADRSLARSRGWRTFRIADRPEQGEILCPASDEAGKRTSCDRCSLCKGSHPTMRDIYIPPHGNGSKAGSTLVHMLTLRR
jgi:hypothetical protein